MILLHGLLGQIHDWQEVLDILEPRARAMALSLPLHAPRLAKFGLAGLAEFVVWFLDALGIPRAVVGGNSLGGHVALTLTLTHPDRVAGLLLAGSSGLFERSVAWRVSHRPSLECVRRGMEQVFHDRRLVTPEWVVAVHRSLSEPSTALAVVRWARVARRDNVESRLAEIAVPALLVWGGQDRITPPTMAERFHVGIPRSTLVVLRNCGHAPMLEQPEAMGAVARAWLEETPLPWRLIQGVVRT